MSEPLEHMYFNWLCSKVSRVQNPTPSLTYYNLLRVLHTTEFVWILDGDDNRAEDGKELRTEFLIEGDIPDHVEWRTQIPCSVLEMLISFSRRAEFNTQISAYDWFWIMIENLNLKEASDASDVDPLEVQDTLDHFMWRRYRSDGDGGLFPLQYPPSDQTRVEIWHQFCDYLVDKDLLV